MTISYKCGTSDTTSICVSSNPVEIFSDPYRFLDDKKGTLFLVGRRVDLIFLSNVVILLFLLVGLKSHVQYIPHLYR